MCPAHNTAFDLATGAVKGEWCPSMPNLPIVGKMGDAKPLPVFKARTATCAAQRSRDARATARRARNRAAGTPPRR